MQASTHLQIRSTRKASEVLNISLDAIDRMGVTVVHTTKRGWFFDRHTVHLVGPSNDVIRALDKLARHNFYPRELS